MCSFSRQLPLCNRRGNLHPKLVHPKLDPSRRPQTTILMLETHSCAVSPGHELRVPAQNDVSASSRHVGGNGHSFAAPALCHHFRFPLHVLRLGIQQLQQAGTQQMSESRSRGTFCKNYSLLGLTVTEMMVETLPNLDWGAMTVLSFQTNFVLSVKVRLSVTEC